MTTTALRTRAVGAGLDRVDGRAKVTGTAHYAFEQPVVHPTYLAAVQSTIARGRIASIDAGAALAVPGVLTVVTHENAPRLASHDDAELDVLQSDVVAFHGQVVAAVVAETPEAAGEAVGLLRIRYEQQEHHVELRADATGLYKPRHVNPAFDTDTAHGDVEAGLASASVRLDATYTTPTEHNNPMEPHATVAVWDETDPAGVTIYDANQGSHTMRGAVTQAFGLDAKQVRVISPHVGGAFGSKAFPHAHLILTVLAAQVVRRPVKYALTRQQMFSLVGYRTPTIQRLRLGADPDGRLTAISHDVVEQTSAIKEFAEQTATPTRMMYAAPNRATTHRLASLDVPVPTIMRAPGETPGMYALESAMDEMAIACGVDPIEFRTRNEPDVDPETGRPFSTRNLVACLREGARRFGWADRDPTPGTRRDGRWMVGTGVAATSYPVYRSPKSTATIRLSPDGRYTVLIDASDIGTGTWTALTQIAADALEVPVERVTVEIGDSALPTASGAGGSSGIASWGSPIVDAARNLRARLDEYGGPAPPGGFEANGRTQPNPDMDRLSMHSFGAQFAEVRVDADTGEVRVPRMLGVFAAGQIVNAKTGRSQLLGGMTMGLSMALHEGSHLDTRFGHYANHDFAEYHIATSADVGTVDVVFLDEKDPHVNPMGSKGIGELGIVGTAAAIANAAHHATGVRVRDLPLGPNAFL